mmetsp:Transcript_27560/g.58240  ORF Transcript_27560/g.58240 Transcript_27560/m.58240 type:complete len:399 (-) Transcript_27560:27-1223(-)|eukprot:CAMPEP_0183741786 /NCGR_PEP_ID=MMETSP0737-20130205/63028_1 /TAXON_ID=385413 /ORGANISM="Thalassiosira miniscula, Strain CCMP1093" /LENGTH=398 /DNA_ID=CAMNT_0025977235 /DNA_START=106 /DNA_END=1302 /DNA_ORIENTATION=-
MNLIAQSYSRLSRARLFHQRQTSIIKCRNRSLATEYYRVGDKVMLKPSTFFASLSLSAAAVTAFFLSPSSGVNLSCEASPTGTIPMNKTSRIATPSWVKESRSTQANCSTQNAHQEVETRTEEESNGIDRFDAIKSEYYKIQLKSTSDSGCKSNSGSAAESLSKTELLHNTIIVMPNLLTQEECEMIVEDTERILEEKRRKAVQGVKTESWTIYSNFGLGCQKIIKRVLEKVVLDFIETRLPDVERTLFRRNDLDRGCKNGEHCQNILPVPKGMAMEYYWDDPVVIKYKAGNKLAPHEDDRDLTIIVPLNPLGSFPLDGGGTRFWLEGTTPEAADETSGISVKPRCGSGIMFNGNITHSGNSVFGGTRFVLMTSITLDDQTNYAEDNDKEEEQKVHDA